MSIELQQDVFDYYFKSCDENKLKETERVLQESPLAYELYKAISDNLYPLSSELEEHVECPQELLEKTLVFVSRHNVDQVPGPEKNSIFYRFFHSGFVRAAAVIFVCFVAAACFLPATGKMRMIAAKIGCQSNLAGISRAISSYSNANANIFPSVEHKPGSPWWKVGSQSDEYSSNTRNYWLLVKHGYITPESFRCPGRDCSVSPCGKVQMASLRDFPTRKHVNYSFMIVTPENAKASLQTRTAIAADTNPIFDFASKLKPDIQEKFLKLHLTEAHRTALSKNHNSQGQNVMFSDGSVDFISGRTLYQDDIYTLQDISTYQGNETSLCTADVFLAP
ncbi:hypothetical protein [Limihaloglobus sulfuriphilus]|nr:hypothetical protein [Limihaloglobus sulfuriphilus]